MVARVLLGIGALLAAGGIMTSVAMGDAWVGPIIFLTGVTLFTAGAVWYGLALVRSRLA